MKKICTLLGRVMLISAILLIGVQQNTAADFTPGSGGSLPVFTPFAELPGKIGGLIVRSSDRENNAFSTGTRALVELRFPEPYNFEADSYTLQYSDNDGILWQNYKYYDADVTTTGDNFSLNVSGNYKFRLLVNGGPKNGYTSNEVFAPLSAVDTRFSGWSLDESMFITGIMAPNIGRGLLAGFSIKKLSDESDVTGALTYQWYRLNPATFETTLIPNATGLQYVTTEADAGYLMLIKATGDGVNAGGFLQIYSSWPNVISNKATVSNVTASGFKLNLFKSLSGGLTVSDLELVDKDSEPVTITSVTAGANAAIYNIAATLDMSKSPYYLINKSSFWLIMSEFEGGFMKLPGVTIDVTTGMTDLDEEAFSVYPVPAKKSLQFKTNSIVYEAALYGVNGNILRKMSINSTEGSMSTSDFSSGIYFLHLKTEKGVLVKKIRIAK